jgi:hypothetical protein
MKETIVLAVLVLFSYGAFSAEHGGKSVQTVVSPDERPCTFFALEGVAEADPIKPNDSWFAVPLDHNGHDVIVSLLLAAYTAGKPVSVVATGTRSCNYAAVRHVYFSFE